MRNAFVCVLVLGTVLAGATSSSAATVRHRDPADLPYNPGSDADLAVLASRVFRDGDGDKIFEFWASTHGGKIGLTRWSVDIDSFGDRRADYSAYCDYRPTCLLLFRHGGKDVRLRGEIRTIDHVERIVVFVPRSLLRVRKLIHWKVFSDAGTTDTSDVAPNTFRYLL
jgi:hypothetical protein